SAERDSSQVVLYETDVRQIGSGTTATEAPANFGRTVWRFGLGETSPAPSRHRNHRANRVRTDQRDRTKRGLHRSHRGRRVPARRLEDVPKLESKRNAMCCGSFTPRVGLTTIIERQIPL